MASQPSTPTLQDALYELTRDGESPTPEALERASRRYPQFADALTDVAISLALGEADHGRPPAETDAERDLVSRAMSHFQNGLYELAQAQGNAAPPRAVPAATEDPFAKMDKRSFRALVARLDANAILVMKLRDRQIRPDTMSDGCRRWLAAGIGTSPEHLFALLSMPTQVRADARYKSDVKPAASEKQSFEEAVRTSGLSEEQQRRLLSR